MRRLDARRLETLLRLLAALLTPACTAVAAERGAAADIDEQSVEFKVLTSDEPVTTMALTEDGLYLVLAHEAAAGWFFHRNRPRHRVSLCLD